eukprot:gnl/MRDRNA2_/MRDRNA2_90496_c0_seq1.p1 gnl/MRDRNA2_/MRDRNA2_90496_c0~~gnl/MRDRNA2_/MRDRNA2_90496_c0_seq1.p1  ORF type:complete len:573 (-),score=129.20 gnl/MRDRNA2_/MRDRNA2_90496_c0_seq1:191-1909(-)
MPLAVLPEKNTFLHFQEDVDTMSRSVTCPGNYVPLTRACSDVWTPPAASSMDADFSASGSKSPCNLVPLEAPAMMPESCEPEAAVRGGTLQRTNSVGGSRFVSSPAPWSKMPVKREPSMQAWLATPSTVVGSPCVSDGEDLLDREEPASARSGGKKRWADLVSDDDATPTQRIIDATNVDEKKRWADLSEDEAEPASSPSNESSQEISLAGDHGIEKKTVDTGLKRPQFSRPSKETRTRQLHTKLDECFELNFDSVDPSQQDGLTHRMLVTLKSLAESISFWTLDGEQVTEEAFRLCDLQEDDMYGIGRLIRKADRLLEERRFRDAYDQLKKARRWFNPETLEEERSKARAHAERNVARKGCKEDKNHQDEQDGDHDGWSKVTQKKEKRNRNVTNQTSVKLEQAGRKKGSKVAETPAPVSKVPKNEQQTRHVTRSHNASHNSNAKSRSAPQKFLCRYIVGIEQNRSFNVVRKLLGDHGAHMKAIAENTGAKLRIRGRGSGFKEGPNNVEADEPLMICISATSSSSFEESTRDVESLLNHVHDQYYMFCEERNLPRPKLVVEQTEQPQMHASH